MLPRTGANSLSRAQASLRMQPRYFDSSSDNQYISFEPIANGYRFPNRPPAFLGEVDEDSPPNASIREHFEALTKDLREPQLAIDPTDLHKPDRSEKGEEDFNILALNVLECIVCRRVPIEARECRNCEVVFCQDCIEKHRKLTVGRNNRKCPQCMEDI